MDRGSGEVPHEYSVLFNSITESIAMCENIIKTLRAAQQNAEDEFIRRGEFEVVKKSKSNN